MDRDDISELRLQLLANGYEPIPNDLKRPVLRGWADKAYLGAELKSGKYADAAAVIRSWAKRFPQAASTGVRLTGGLTTIDGDLDDDGLAQRLTEVIHKVAPAIVDATPFRLAKGDNKCAWFIRTEGEPFTRMCSRTYGRPAELAAWRAARAAAAEGDEVPPPALHRVEIFGGAPTKSGQCSRQFGVYGPHSRGPDGATASWYRFAPANCDLLNVPLGGLVTGTTAQCRAIVQGFDQAMDGDPAWEAVTADDVGITADSEVCFDIDETTRFDTNVAGRGLTYAELSDAYAAMPGGSLRCSTSFIKDRAGTKDNHCHVGWSKRHDCVSVWVYGDETLHLPADKAPFAEFDKMAGILKEIGPVPTTGGGEPPAPADNAPLADKVSWLLQTRAYFEAEHSVVQLYATGLDCRSKVGAFELRYRAWFDRPDNKRKPMFATEAWVMASLRKNIVGVRMRPDRPFPLYEEHGRLYKNTYRAPQHDGAGGDVAEFMVFMERFIPDPIERGFLLDWMAHKLRRPDIPGTALIFVADTIDGTREGAYGTGRGLMFRIAHQLYGEQYTKAQSFSVLEGSSSQSAYNDWLHGAVLVTIDEAKTSPTSHRRGERSATYEVLKDLVDPAPKQFTFTGKYRQAFDGMSYCSIWLASNHSDALAIPAGDRRFTVLRNGRPIAPAEAVAIDAWMRQPANIGALAAMLGQRDLSGFNMFVPLETAGKTEMADAARTEVDELMRDLIADPKRGLVFTRGALEQVVEAHFGRFAGMWQGDLKGAWPKYCCTLKDENGKPKRAQYGGTRDNLVCFRAHHARANMLPQAALRREAAKWNESGVHHTPLAVVKTPHE